MSEDFASRRRCGKQKRQGAIISRVLSPRTVSLRTSAGVAAIHLGRRLLDGSSSQPGSLGAKPACLSARDPYSALLRVGFAMRTLLPAPRCAFTAPFHPCLCPFGPSAVCSLWHFPLRPEGTPAGVTRHPCFVEPGLSSHLRGCLRPPDGRDIGLVPGNSKTRSPRAQSRGPEPVSRLRGTPTVLGLYRVRP